MIDQCNPNVQSLLFGCLACLVVTSVVNADGRVFVLDLRNSSGVQGFRDAEQACASQHARLASAEELRHAVVECFFSQCTRGWLYGGTVGTTVCNIVGSSLKAVAVRTENATEDMAHLGAFCVKDKGLPCGDPPSFPNALLEEHSGFEMGDELVYTCMSGYVMPSGHTAFSLLCDSCGEWYGAVQICVKDEPESHVDYEDKFTDSYEEADHDHESIEEPQDELSEETYDGKRSIEQQEKTSNVKVQERHQEQHENHDLIGKVTENTKALEGAIKEGAKNEEPAFEDFTSHPRWEEEKIGLVSVDVAAATEEPVSVLSQKHMFWFPPEAFPEEEPPVSTDPVTQNPTAQITQRASGGQSEESKEHESQERPHHPIPIDVDDHDDEPEGYDDHEHDNDDRDEQDNSRHDNLDIHEDDRYDDQDDFDSHQEEDHDDHMKSPAQHDDLDRQDRHKDHDDHDDHYDMGEHEEDRDHIQYGSQEYDDRDDTHDEHHSHEDHDDHSDDDGEYPDVSEDHPDHDDHDKDDDKDHDMDHDDHEHKDDELYDNHDSHEEDDHVHAIISGAPEGNITQKVPGGKATKDESWLDGYPVVLEETDDGKTSKDQTGPVDGESVVKTTDRPNEVEIRRPVPYTSPPDTHESPTKAPELDHKVVEKGNPSFAGTPAASPDHLQPSDTPSYSDTLDYDTQQAAPTHTWLDDLTEHPFLDHGPAPPVQDGDIFNGVIGEHTVHNLPGENGERGEADGEMREAMCLGEDCPPHPPNPSSQGPKVAAIIVAVCAVATAVIVGVWCYRRQQQKSSMYEMNGKGQSQTRQGQQIEMQQKV